MKKFLSLVLALVMTMSLVTISAGAKDFTDADKVTYTEAVDVLSAVKVIDGYTDGAFKPTTQLNRGQAAKILCNMILGPTTASALKADAAPFKDVAADNTFAAYIAYCAKEGIIDGYTDGTFRPAAPLTGYAFMKLLLGALGYDKDLEGYNGNNWSINVAKRALAIGLDDGLVEDFDGTKIVTRDEACLFALNTLKATMVDYDSRTSVSVGGAEVVISGSKAYEVYNGAATEGIKNDDKMQFAEKYFTKLTKTEGTDDFARPATTWRNKGTKIGTYADTADKTYSENVKLGTIYADLGMTEKDSAAEVFINGVAGDSVAVAKQNTAKIADKIASTYYNYDGTNTNKLVNTGSTVEVFYDDDTNNVRICVIDTYVGTIQKSVEATSAKDAYIVIDEASVKFPAGFNDEFETDEKFEDDAVVLYTYSDKTGEIKSVELAEAVTGTLTKIVTGDKLTIGDKEYDYAIQADFDSSIGTEAGLKTKSDYTAYLDPYGNIIYLVEEEYVSGDYALIVAIESAGSSAFTTNRVKLLTADGVVKIYNTEKNYLSASYGYTATDIVTYKVRDDGTVTLKKVSSPLDNMVTTGTDPVTITWNGGSNDNGSATFNLTKNDAEVTVVAGTTKFYANSKTVFVVRDGNGDYTAYTGIANVPTITPLSGKKVGVAWYCKTTDLATVVFIDAANASIVNNSKDVIFLAGKSASNKTIDADDNVYYTYNAVVKGELTTVTVQANANTIADGVFDASHDVTKADLVFSGATYDGDGIITDFSAIGGSVSSANMVSGTVKLSGEYTIGTGTAAAPVRWTVAKDAKIWTIDDSGKIKAAELKDIKTDANNKLTYTKEDGELTNIFVRLPADSNTVAPSTPVVTNVTNITYDGSDVLTVAVTSVPVATSYSVTIYEINGGTQVKLGTYTVPVAASATSGSLNIGALNAGYTHLAVCGDKTFGI